MNRTATCRVVTASLAAAIVGSLIFAVPAAAQLPVATGRQITMSNAAWKLFIPSTYQQRPGNVADVLVHFHGDPQTYWNNAKYANLNTIIVTVNYSGLSSAYSTPFSNAALFQTVLDEALDQSPPAGRYPRQSSVGQARRFVVQRRLRRGPRNPQERNLPQRHRRPARRRLALRHHRRRRHAARLADGRLQNVRQPGQERQQDISCSATRRCPRIPTRPRKSAATS